MNIPANKRYEITIVEHCDESLPAGKTWSMGAGNTPEEYGYTPQIERITRVERQIYKQNIEALNLTEIIKAVNGIGES